MHVLLRKHQALFLALLFAQTSFGQIGIGTALPDVHAILHVNSTTKGVLIPRLNSAQQTTLAATLTKVETGMLIADAASGALLVWGGSSFVAPDKLAGKDKIAVSATNQVSLNPGTAAGDLITWDGSNWVNMQPAIQHFSVQVNNLQPYLTMNFCIAMNGIFPARNDGTPFVSQIQIFPFNFAPVGWAFCNGQLLAISQNTALFSLLGTQYGGNGTSNFALPNLQGCVSIDAGQGPGLSNFIQGQTGGSTTVTIAH